MTAPEQIWAWGWAGESQPFRGQWEVMYILAPSGGHEYIRHDAAALAASPVVRDMIRQAFRAGFMRSGEGWNGEYPCDGDADEWLAVEATEYAAAIRARKGE